MAAYMLYLDYLQTHKMIANKNSEEVWNGTCNTNAESWNHKEKKYKV